MDESRRISLPPVILCAGLPRSGSTWIYNAVLLLCKQTSRTSGFYSDTTLDNLQKIIKDTDVIVIKAHHPNEDLLEFVRFIGGKIIVSIRDPRDCVASLIEAFDYTKIGAMTFVENSIDSIHEIVTRWPHHIVRYENALNRASIVAALAAEIGCPVDTAATQAISDALETGKIRDAIAKWEVDGTLDSANPAQSCTEETHWHPRHVGDGRAGKYKDFLSPAEAILIGRRSSLFMERFGYAFEEPPAISADTFLNLADEGSIFAVQGVSRPESWGAWTDGPLARFELSFTNDVSSVRLGVQFVLGPCLQKDDQATTGIVRINNEEAMEISGSMYPNPEIMLIHNCKPNENGLVILEFIFYNLKSPLQMNVNHDKRLIGIGIRNISLKLQKNRFNSI